MERKQTALRTMFLNNVAFERSFNDGIDREVNPSAGHAAAWKKAKWEMGEGILRTVTSDGTFSESGTIRQKT
jgi:hypothetical protein